MEKVHERATRTKTSGKAALGMEEKFRRRERLEEGRQGHCESQAGEESGPQLLPTSAKEPKQLGRVTTKTPVTSLAKTV